MTNKDFDRRQGLGGSARSIVADEKVKELVNELRNISLNKKRLEMQYQDQQFKIMRIMQDNEIIEDKNGTTLVTWKESDRKAEDGSIKSSRIFRLC